MKYGNKATYSQKIIKSEKTTFQRFHLSAFGGEKKVNNESDEKKDNYSTDLGEGFETSIGPEPLSDELTSDVLKKWIDDVITNPIPIDIEFTEIRSIIKSKEHQDMFSAAVRYYLTVKKKRFYDTFNSFNIESALLRLLKESFEMILINVEATTKVCERGRKIALGFGATFNENGKLLHVKYCTPGLNTCLLEVTKAVKVSFIWALCHKIVLLEYKQVLVKGDFDKDRQVKDSIGISMLQNTASCPKYMAIAFGVIMKLSFDESSSVQVCRNGIRKCSHADLGPNGFIWLLCVPIKTPGIKLIHQHTNTKHDVKAKCKEGYKIIKGF
ncbi:Membrane attack complex component-perforin (MACPF) domain [Babesia duncani]|uniref:Membrane attack complex component-perforin (MACPF) domain n=1 Tax=Babesia duncani TaxID=323732 RepID=A0AAD9PJA5_9APIC|nr:Membrane attack complex component-perforin (MACPF) domain [Babesia duncani]